MNRTAHDDWFQIRSIDVVCDAGLDVGATHYDFRYDVVRYSAARSVIRFEAAWWHVKRRLFLPESWWRFSRKHQCWVFIGHNRPDSNLRPVF